MFMDLDSGDHRHTHRDINRLFRPHQVSDHIFNSLNYRIVEVCRSYTITTTYLHYPQHILMAKIASLRDTAHREANFVLLGLSSEGALAGWNNLTRRWHKVKGYRKELTFVDVISYRNNFYAINTRGQLYKVSHQNNSKGKPTKAPAGTFIGIDDEYWHYNHINNNVIHVLLESDGCLYLLDNDSSDQFNQKLNIYVLDEKGWEWKAVKGIKDRVFFVVRNVNSCDPLVAFSLSTEDLRWDNGDCVYRFNFYNTGANWIHWEYSISSCSFELKHYGQTNSSKPLEIVSRYKRSTI